MNSSVPTLQSLPPEILEIILLNIPLSNLSKIFQTSRSLNRFCHDWHFWAQRAKKDYEFPIKYFNETTLTEPIERYNQIKFYLQHPQQYFLELAEKGNIDLIKYLVTHASFGKDNIYKLSTLDYTLNHAAKYLNVVEYLVSQGADIDNALIYAAENGYLEIIKYGLNYYYKHHSIMQLLNQLLDLATRGGHVNIMKYLIAEGANDINTALLAAISSNKDFVIPYLVSLGANNLNSALMLAVENGYLPIVKYLVSHGANNLNTALNYAFHYNRIDIIQYLDDIIENNTSFNEENNEE